MSKKKNLMIQSLVKSVASVEVEVTILPELRDFIPPLGQEEFAQLEANILAEGCRESLLLWTNPEGKHILIDGHNRYRICQKHGLKFETVSKSFADLSAVKTWMIENQLGRRNLNPKQISYLRGVRYNTEKQAKGGDRKSKSQNRLLISTAQQLGEEYQVSKNTIKRDAEFAKGLDHIGESNPDLKKQILAGECKVKKSDIQFIGKQDSSTLPPLHTAEEVTKVREQISKKPKKESVKTTPKTTPKNTARKKKQQQQTQKLKQQIAEKVLQISQPTDIERIEKMLQKLKKIIP